MLRDKHNDNPDISAQPTVSNTDLRLLDLIEFDMDRIDNIERRLIELGGGVK